MNNKIQTWLEKPGFRVEPTTFGFWVLTRIIFALIKSGIGKYNNYKIFESVYWHARERFPLYGDQFAEYNDSNHFGIICSPSPHRNYKKWLQIVTCPVGGISSEKLVPRSMRQDPIQAYVVKVWLFVLVWLTICYGMICPDFAGTRQERNGSPLFHFPLSI